MSQRQQGPQESPRTNNKGAGGREGCSGEGPEEDGHGDGRRRGSGGRARSPWGRLSWDSEVVVVGGQRRRPRSSTEPETQIEQIEQIEVLDLTQDCIIVE